MRTAVCPFPLQNAMTEKSLRKSPFYSESIGHLKDVLLDISGNPYPELPNPPETKKRASVALIVRIKPHYEHWPPKHSAIECSDANIENTGIKSASRQLQDFFEQDWVKNGDPEILFIKRAERKGDRWTSHVALPGGRRDPKDEDDRAAAVRETFEEVGIELTSVNSIAAGNLPQRMVKTSWGLVP